MEKGGQLLEGFSVFRANFLLHDSLKVEWKESAAKKYGLERGIKWKCLPEERVDV